MSFMIHMQSFMNGEVYEFPRTIVWNVFFPRSHWVREGWALTYDTGFAGVLYLKDAPLIDGCSINRPGDPALIDLFEVARRVPSLINWDCNSAIANPAFLAGIPDWLLNALGKPPSVVHSGEGLLWAIARS
jgi:hypothetical protein